MYEAVALARGYLAMMLNLSRFKFGFISPVLRGSKYMALSKLPDEATVAKIREGV